MDLPDCGGWKLSVSATLCLLVGACATLEEATPVSWRFSLDCRSDADRTEVVELKVAEGVCPLSETVIFETVTAMWNARGSRPQGFPEGSYAFQATARDVNGEIIAEHCESVMLPVAKEISLNLQGTSACGNDTGDGEDGGSSNGGSSNGGSSNGGSPLDSGIERDAGPDGGGSPCPDESDRDTDGVLDCVDQCPDDSMKSMPGQCGCGASDVDGDGDGTSDCLDMCATDPNKTAPGTLCGCNPKTTLTSNQTLIVDQYLCGPKDDSVRLVMEMDGNLHLRVNDVQVWVSDSKLDMMGQKGVSVKMQGDGNLVIRSPNAPVWDSKTVGTPAVLSVHANGTATIIRDGEAAWTAPM